MLLKHYPERLLASTEFKEMQEALGPEVYQLRASLYSFGDQLNVETATWGLCAWERALGIPVDVSKSDTDRRNDIMSKLRGVGTVTASMLAGVVKSFVRGDVSVSEIPEQSTIIIKFDGEYGVPDGIDKVKSAVEKIKPAHLAIDYAYHYLLIRDVHEAMTINELNEKPLGIFAGGSD